MSSTNNDSFISFQFGCPLFIFKKILLRLEDDSEYTSPYTWVKHLADLLSNKVNSQQYPTIYEDRRAKRIEETEKTYGKGIASGQKGPWDQCRDQGDCSPRPLPARPATGLLRGSWVNSFLPFQTRFEQH